MTQDKENKLFKDFRFFHPEKSLQESLMGFGMECGDGWYNLIYNLCKDIQNELDKNPELKESFEVIQVKEKYGSLRFYVNSANSIIYDLIDEAEAKSYNICENCGEEGKHQQIKGWWTVTCEACKNWRVVDNNDYV